MPTVGEDMWHPVPKSLLARARKLQQEVLIHVPCPSNAVLCHLKIGVLL